MQAKKINLIALEFCNYISGEIKLKKKHRMRMQKDSLLFGIYSYLLRVVLGKKNYAFNVLLLK